MYHVISKNIRRNSEIKIILILFCLPMCFNLITPQYVSGSEESPNLDATTASLGSRFRSVSFGQYVEYNDWIFVSDFCYYYGCIQWIFTTTPAILLEVWIVDDENYERFIEGEYALGFCVAQNNDGYGIARPIESNIWHVLIWNKYYLGLVYIEGEVGFEIFFEIDNGDNGGIADSEGVEEESKVLFFIGIGLIILVSALSISFYVVYKDRRLRVPLIKGTKKSNLSNERLVIIAELSSDSRQGIPKEFYKIVHSKQGPSGRIELNEMVNLGIPKRTKHASYFYKRNILHIRFKGKA